MGMSTYARVTPARARIDRGSDRNQFLVTDVAPVNAPQSIGLQATVENAVHWIRIDRGKERNHFLVAHAQ